MERRAGLAPVIVPGARALLLGSMPSALSLEKGEYYGNPRNHFWPLVFALLEGGSAPPDYAARLALLARRGLALWDSIAACERQGSLDAAIRNALPNDIPGLLQANPSIRAVLFNGSKARAVYQAHFGPQPGVRYLILPSSSPVPRRGFLRMEDKLPAWRAAFLQAGLL